MTLFRHVTIRLVGGLGNQMFQYATARAVALRLGVPLRLDLSWFGTEDPNRSYALGPLRIDASVARAGMLDTLRMQVGRRLAARLRPLPISLGHALGYFAERSFRYDDRVMRLRAPVFMEGYYQSACYFMDARDRLLTELGVREAPAATTAACLDAIRSSDAICLHVRRGDYVSNPAAQAMHGTCSLDYYARGIELASAGLRTPHAFIFSDDPVWVRANLRLGIPSTVVDIHGPDQAHEDLRLMSACRRFVIANSSLSWWGAWLAPEEDKIVVAPSRWFARDDVDTRDLIPPTWVRV